jgi:regulatory protein
MGPMTGEQQQRLDRAAAALAAAEVGPVDVGAGISEAPDEVPPEERRGRRRGGRRRPPPEDGAAVASEADPYAVARSIVLRQLTMAPRSRAQLEKKLRDRGCPDDVAEAVLDRMTEVGLVDDQAYAEMVVRSKQEGRGLARRGLAHELRRRGVEDEVAEEALAQVSREDERVAAEELVARRLRSLHGLPPQVQARRLGGMLARKGYDGELAWSVVRAALAEAPEHLRD